MNDEDAISFAQHCLDTFMGHEVSDDLIRHRLNDWRRDSKNKTAEEVDEWYEGKRQRDEDSYRDEQ